MAGFINKLFGMKRSREGGERLSIGLNKDFPIAMVVLDRKFQIVSYSKKWQKQFRLDDLAPAEIIGQPINILIDMMDSDESRWMSLFKRASHGEYLSKPEDVFYYTESDFDWIEWSVSPWMNVDGKSNGVIFCSQVITQQVQLQKYFKLSFYMFCNLSEQGYFIDTNETFLKVIGYEKKAVVRRSIYDFIHPDDLESTAEVINQIADTTKTITLVNRIHCKSGEYKYFEWSLARDTNSEMIYAVVRDVTTEHYQEVVIKRKNELLDSLVFIQESFMRGRELGQLMMAVLERLQHITQSPLGFVGIVERDQHDEIFLKLEVVRGFDWDEEIIEFYNQYNMQKIEIHDMDTIFGKTIQSGETVIKNNVKGEYSEFTLPMGFDCNQYFGMPIFGSEGVIGMVALMDRKVEYEADLINYIQPVTRIIGSIYEAHENVVQLQQMARYDRLTGLLSREYFEAKLHELTEHAAEKDSPLALVYIDITKFKHINDMYGHTVGDHLLDLISKRLINSLDEKDYIGRIGGDEFSVIIADVERFHDIVLIANRIRKALSEPYTLPNVRLSVDVNLGVARYPEAGEDVPTLQKHADFALYEAKNKESGIQIYTSEVKDIYNERLLIENSIIRGLEDNEFYLVYQPLIDATTRKIIGVESLIRWNHSTLGVLCPDEFVSIIEECGKADLINLWVVRRIEKDLREFPQDLIKDFVVSFNFSPAVNNIYEHMDKIINLLDSEMPGRHIQIEITEQNISDKKFSMPDFAERLAQSNVSFSIDDFGKNFSSLRRLVELPIQTIKIDIDFVRDMLNDKKTEQVVISIINLASSLNLQVIAEGVETKAQLDALVQLGCHKMQGYYFDKPLSVDHLTALINQGVGYPE